MRKLILSLAATPLILGSMAVSAQAADDGFNIFSDVKFKGELRPRYQFTDVKEVSGSSTPATQKDAGSSVTNRTNLNFTAKLFELDGMNGTIELNAVNDFGSQQGPNQNGGEALVAKISQANIDYTVAGVTGIIGRKTVNLDNQRFIGSVGWKQNFQTLDLAAVAYGIGGFSILGAYVYGVNAIGDAGYDYGRNPEPKYAGGIGSGRTNSFALNASYKIMDPVKVTGYAYLLGSASDTYGLAVTGKVAMGDIAKLNYRVEGAVQQKATLKTFADGVVAPGSGHEDSILGKSGYVNLDVGANISGFLVGLNYEVLGGAKAGDNSTTAFQTPLATKHKFNGWADQFLATPGTGLADLNIRGGYKFDKYGKIIAFYHFFGAAADEAAGGGNGKNGDDMKSGDAYGQEFDIAYSIKVPSVNGLGLLVKAAMYKDSDDTKGIGFKTGADSDKTLAWVQLDYKFATK